MHTSRPLPAPPPASIIIPEQVTRPLVVQKRNPTIPPPPVGKPPSPPLLVPTPPRRPNITILISNNNSEGYGNGFSGESVVQGATTIRPSDSKDIPTHNAQDLSRMISVLNGGLKPDEEEERKEPSFSDKWSDDVLEVLSSLGEGAGGIVHKVKDKRTGKVLARKTITTRAAPMRQLERELSIMPTKHCNIVRFRGAYMSPSSSEVKIVMEYCEGGSLETIGKRIKEKEAVVGEKIAGRIAESVCWILPLLFDMPND